MASTYIASETTTVTDSTTSIAAAALSLQDGDRVEVTATNAAIWLNHKGGTAAASASDCIPVPEDTGVQLVYKSGLQAIRIGGTNSLVTVSILGG